MPDRHILLGMGRMIKMLNKCYLPLVFTNYPKNLLTYIFPHTHSHLHRQTEEHSLQKQHTANCYAKPTQRQKRLGSRIKKRVPHATLQQENIFGIYMYVYKFLLDCDCLKLWLKKALKFATGQFGLRDFSINL